MQVNNPGASCRGTTRSPIVSRAAGVPCLAATHTAPFVSDATPGESRYPGATIGVSLVSRNRSMPVGVPIQRLPSRSYIAVVTKLPLIPAVRENGMVIAIGPTVFSGRAAWSAEARSGRRTRRSLVPKATGGWWGNQTRS
jgi:hypothetical protein